MGYRNKVGGNSSSGAVCVVAGRRDTDPEVACLLGQRGLNAVQRALRTLGLARWQRWGRGGRDTSARASHHRPLRVCVGGLCLPFQPPVPTGVLPSQLVGFPSDGPAGGGQREGPPSLPLLIFASLRSVPPPHTSSAEPTASPPLPPPPSHPKAPGRNGPPRSPRPACLVSRAEREITLDQ